MQRHYLRSVKRLIRALLDDIRNGPEERVRRRRRSMIRRDQLPGDRTLSPYVTRPSTTGLHAPVAEGKFEGRLRKVS